MLPLKSGNFAALLDLGVSYLEYEIGSAEDAVNIQTQNTSYGRSVSHSNQLHLRIIMRHLGSIASGQLCMATGIFFK